MKTVTVVCLKGDPAYNDAKSLQLSFLGPSRIIKYSVPQRLKHSLIFGGLQRHEEVPQRLQFHHLTERTYLTAKYLNYKLSLIQKSELKHGWHMQLPRGFSALGCTNPRLY